MSDHPEFDLPDDLLELERALENLQPERLDPVVHGRLSTAILYADADEEPPEDQEPPASSQNPKIVFLASTLAAAAAAIAIAFGISFSSNPQPVSVAETSAPWAEPAAATSTSRIPANAADLATRSELVEIVDEGIISTETSTRMRQLRSVYTDTVSWVDHTTDARTQLSYQREELFLIPIDGI